MEPLSSKEPRNPKKDQVEASHIQIYTIRIYYIKLKQYDTAKKHTKIN